jgi:hypothetical protein
VSDLTLWLALIGGEVVLVVLVLLLVAWVRERAARNNARSAVATLVSKVKTGKGDRERAVRELLSNRFGLAGEALEATTLAIVREERRLYQTFANVYLQRDDSAAAAFDLSVEAAVGPYWGLKGGGEAAPAQAPVDTGEIEQLRQENRRLSEELQITMDTMTRMLSEYSAVFGKENGDAQTNAAAQAPVSDAQQPVFESDPDPMADTVPAAEVDNDLEPSLLDDFDDDAALVPEELSAEGAPQGEAAEPPGDGLEEWDIDEAFDDAGDKTPGRRTVTDAEADALLADALGESALSVDDFDDLDGLDDLLDADDDKHDEKKRPDDDSAIAI